MKRSLCRHLHSRKIYNTHESFYLHNLHFSFFQSSFAVYNMILLKKNQKCFHPWHIKNSMKSGVLTKNLQPLKPITKTLRTTLEIKLSLGIITIWLQSHLHEKKIYLSSVTNCQIEMLRICRISCKGSNKEVFKTKDHLD